LDVALTQMVLKSSEGVATGLRVASLLIIVVMYRKRVQGIALWAGLSAAYFAATSFALVGHASEVVMQSRLSLLPQMLLGLHLLAVAFWLGALWPLHRSTYTRDMTKVSVTMERFGRLAAFVVGLLIVVGIVLLWLLLDKPEALWGTAYGQLFLIKLFCVALLLALAAMNKLRLAPQLLGGECATVQKLRRSIKAEIGVASLILLATATLTTVTGPAN
jgi:putative copper export protein